MDLSPGEEALIHLVRAGSLGDFGLTLTRKHETFVLTFASPEENGIGMGAGPTLDAAIYSSIGMEAPDAPDGGEPAQPEPAKVLRLVGGIHASPVGDRRCTAMEAA